MIFHDRRLSLSDIDRDDTRYQITTERENAALIRSIRSLGLLSPPILIPRKNDAYIIVAGFRRIDAFIALGETEIPVRLPDAGTDGLACAEIAISDNLFRRPLNLIEESKALALLEQFCPDQAVLAEKAKMLQLPSNPDMISKLLCLDRLPSNLKNGVRDTVLPLSIALELSKLAPEDSNLLADLFFTLKPGLNKQREMMTLIKEIGLREDVSIREILTHPDVQSVLEDEKKDRNVKIGELRKYFKKRRFPSIVRAENAFRQFVKELNLGKEAQLIPPRDFEGMEYTLSLKFSDRASLENHRQTLLHVLEQLPVQDILS